MKTIEWQHMKAKYEALNALAKFLISLIMLATTVLALIKAFIFFN